MSHTRVCLPCLISCSCCHLLEILLLLHHLLLLLRGHPLHLLLSFLLLYLLLLSHLWLLLWLSSHLLLLSLFRTGLSCIFFSVCTLLSASGLCILFLLALVHVVRLGKLVLWGCDLNVLGMLWLLRHIYSDSYFSLLIVSFHFFFATFLIPSRFLSILASVVLSFRL